MRSLVTRWLDLSLESIFRTSGLLLAFVGLVSTEQAIRAAPEDAARILRLCAVLVGGIFAYDLFLFSQRTCWAHSTRRVGVARRHR
jgi:hypothetical protein